MTDFNERLLEVLKRHTINNALEVARDVEYWYEGDGEDARQEFLGAIERCMDGNGTAEDWDWIIAETEM